MSCLPVKARFFQYQKQSWILSPPHPNFIHTYTCPWKMLNPPKLDIHVLMVAVYSARVKESWKEAADDPIWTGEDWRQSAYDVKWLSMLQGSWNLHPKIVPSILMTPSFNKRSMSTLPHISKTTQHTCRKWELGEVCCSGVGPSSPDSSGDLDLGVMSAWGWPSMCWVGNPREEPCAVPQDVVKVDHGTISQGISVYHLSRLSSSAWWPWIGGSGGSIVSCTAQSLSHARSFESD